MQSFFFGWGKLIHHEPQNTVEAAPQRTAKKVAAEESVTTRAKTALLLFPLPPSSLRTLKPPRRRSRGKSNLTQVLGVGKDWVCRRLSSETPIDRVDELAVMKAADEDRRRSQNAMRGLTP